MLFPDKQIYFVNETDSTNSYATNLIKQYEPPEGSVVYTEFQSAGRGLDGHSWLFVPKVSLAASWILYPSFLTSSSIHYLYLVASLALYDVLSALDLKAKENLRIKWPNDILFQNRKMAGILIECQWMGSTCKSAVVGIGLNLFSHPLLASFAAADELSSGLPSDLKTWVDRITLSVEKYYSLLKIQQLRTLEERYIQHLWGYGQEVEFCFKDKTIRHRGIIRGIDSNGRLWVEENSRNYFFSSKEIVFFRENPAG